MEVVVNTTTRMSLRLHMSKMMIRTRTNNDASRRKYEDRKGYDKAVAAYLNRSGLESDARACTTPRRCPRPITPTTRSVPLTAWIIEAHHRRRSKKLRRG